MEIREWQGAQSLAPSQPLTRTKMSGDKSSFMI
jgi:hypothetical protein